MDIPAIREFLLWCTIINFGLLFLAWLTFVLAHDWIQRFHGKWYMMPRERFVGIHYAGMAMFKILILVFNLVPYVVLVIVG